MALDKIVAQLAGQLESLRVALEALGFPLLEDKSRTDDVALSAYSADALTEATDLLRQAIPATKRAGQAAKHPANLDGVRIALATCQEKVGELERRFRDGLMSFENIEALSTLRRRGGQWEKWAEAVVTGLQESQERLRLVNETILLCWQEIAERAGTVSVRASAIGKKVVNIGEAKTTAGDGMT